MRLTFDRFPSRIDEHRRAWMTLIGGVTALAWLATVLPSPMALVGGAEPAGAAPAAGVDAISTALLRCAAVIVWPLLGWGFAVLALGGLTRLPGLAGHRARRVLSRVVPPAARSALVLSVGVGLAAGLTACGQPGPAGPAASVVQVAAGSGSAGSGSGRWGADGPGLDLDWPSADPVTSRFAPAPQINLDWPTSVPRSSSATTATISPRPSPQAGPGPPSKPTGPPAVQPTQPAAGPTVVAAPTVSRPARAIVTVTSGDTLWAIAAAELGPRATAGQIGQRWPDWYLANRAVIGSDPDLILPGQHLQSPTNRPSSTTGATP